MRLHSTSAMVETAFRDLFVATWTEIRRALEGAPSIGLVVVAVDTQSRRVVSTLHVGAQVAMPATSIVGSHPACDICLDGDPTISLRHLALVMLPLCASESARGFLTAFRVLDLRSRAAFADEAGRSLESITADGPAFLAVGKYVLFILTADDERNWPEAGEDAWDCIPERVYLEDHEATWRRRHPVSMALSGLPHLDRASVIRTRAGPSRRSFLPTDTNDGSLGELIVSAPRWTKHQCIVVGKRAAETGILIGRFERCDTYGSELMRDPGISRVHVLVLLLDDELYAVDTSSTNGSFCSVPDGHERRIRVTGLTPAVELVLGNDLARITWSPRAR